MNPWQYLILLAVASVFITATVLIIKFTIDRKTIAKAPNDLFNTTTVKTTITSTVISIKFSQFQSERIFSHTHRCRI